MEHATDGSGPMPAPDFLTVEEAAQVLRIGRTAAYREARRYEATNGAAGIPVERIGKQYRVPRHRIEEKLGGPITWPPAPTPPAVPVEPGPLTLSTARRRSRRSRRRVDPPQLFGA